jgi:hypothetical protein
MRRKVLPAHRIWRKAAKVLFAAMPHCVSRRCRTNVSQHSPTCSGEGQPTAVTPPAKKDEPEATGKDFDWIKDDDNIVLRDQPETAVYFNPQGGLVIRQQCWPDDDVVVIINPECINRFIGKLKDIVGITGARL